MARKTFPSTKKSCRLRRHERTAFTVIKSRDERSDSRVFCFQDALMKRAIVVVVVIVAAVIVFFFANAWSDNVDGLGGDPWTLVAAKTNGRELPREEIEGVMAHFTKNEVTWIVMTDEGPVGRKGKFAFDSIKQPKTVDVETLFANMRNLPGIYELKNNMLVMALALGDRRPTDFSGRSGLVLIFKR
jgi:uncharacterized protein (TIGR03067 family)